MITAIKNFLNSLIETSSSRELRNKLELQRLGALQETASHRRMEYARAKEQAEFKDNEPASPDLVGYRKRMDEAETAHYLALQSWENRESGQKSY
jgi:hypothetical protein